MRIKAADGSVLLEKILRPGETYVVPRTDSPPILRTGEAGAVYFAVNGQTYGPAGTRGQVLDQIALVPQALTDRFALADPAQDANATRAVAVAEAALGLQSAVASAE